ncbi:MAG: IclR family transcriptional regulator [Alphaproteobacteria bacterium]
MARPAVQPPASAGENRYAVEAVTRAARVLALFDRARPRQSLAELAERSGVPRLTLRGILDTLAAHDLLIEEGDGFYRLGYAWLRFADVRRNQLDIRGSAVPIMRAIRDGVNETVILSLRIGDRRVHLDYVESTQPIRRITQPGHEGPVHVGAAGMVLMSGFSDAELAAYRARSPDIADPEWAAVLAGVADAKRDGHSVVAGKVNVHTAAVAAPVRAYSGEIIATLTISCPTDRFTPELSERCVRLVTDGAAKLSRALGYSA